MVRIVLTTGDPSIFQRLPIQVCQYVNTQPQVPWLNNTLGAIGFQLVIFRFCSSILLVRVLTGKEDPIGSPSWYRPCVLGYRLGGTSGIRRSSACSSWLFPRSSAWTDSSNSQPAKHPALTVFSKANPCGLRNTPSFFFLRYLLPCFEEDVSRTMCEVRAAAQNCCGTLSEGGVHSYYHNMICISSQKSYIFVTITVRIPLYLFFWAEMFSRWHLIFLVRIV